MSGVAESSQLDHQVLECLQATLSPLEPTRRAAENQLKHLFQHPHEYFPLHQNINVVTSALTLPLYSAGILLQKYIRQHWYPAADEYERPTTPAEVKDALRPLLLHALSDPERKVRVASAFAASTIARFDWPEDWPDLLSSLVVLLQNGDANSVHGAMRVVAEFVKNDLSEDQLLPVVRDLVPALLGILGNPQTHSFTTRATTVSVYRHILTVLQTVREEHPEAVRQALEQMAPVWFGAFSQLLSVDAASDVATSWESLALRIQIFRVLSHFQTHFPKYLAPHVPAYLRLSILNLTSLLQTFHSYYITSDPDAPTPPEPVHEGGGGAYVPKMDVDDFGCAVFEFLDPTVRVNRAKSILVDQGSAEGLERGTAVMETIIGLVLTYTQVTRDNEEEWLENANAFVEDEDEDGGNYSLRVVGHDLVASLIDKWPRAVGRIVNDYTHRRVQESVAARDSGNADWWKPLEAVLALLGGLSEDLRALIEEDSKAGLSPTLDLQWLFDQVVPGLLEQHDTPFLQGRAFVFASHFAGSLPPQLAGQYLSAAVHALTMSTISGPVKLSAVKTIKNFCRFVNPDLMRPRAAEMLALLLPVLPQTSDETLYLVLETVHAVVSLDKDSLPIQTTTAVCEQAYIEWFKNTTDPVVTAIIDEIVTSLMESTNPSVLAAVVDYFAPRLADMILLPVSDDTVHIAGESVQLANALLRPRAGPLEPQLIATVTAAIMTCLATTDDMDVIQHGMIHLTLVVRKDCDKLVQWHDAEGKNGIASIFSLLARFLAPTFSESGGIFVGDLIMHLFRKAGPAMAPVLGDLLRAVVNRLASAVLPSFITSLIIPFAYLFGTEHTQNTIDLLSQFAVTLPNGTQRPALDMVLSAWCEVAETITGSWNIRVNDIGLAKMFALPSPALRAVIVKGDLVIDESNRDRIMTRSKTKLTPTVYTQIPFPVKALKLLLKDVQAEGSGSKTNVSGAQYSDYPDLDDDDGDAEWDDDDPLASAGPSDEFGFLADWLNDTGGGENDAQDDDEDLRSDPLVQIDIGKHLGDVLRSSYASNQNGMHEMVEGLTDGEKGVLKSVLTIG